ncbi:MAG: hypothetical protein NDI94_07295 [Candidatus Woesearchaeota archaeon]|nr:hypothetical protein [Candidatus Woesearchaeota archaeon]
MRIKDAILKAVISISTILLFLLLFEIILRMTDWQHIGIVTYNPTEGEKNITHFENIGYLQFYRFVNGQPKPIDLKKERDGDSMNHVLYHDYFKMKAVCDEDIITPKIIFIGDSVMKSLGRYRRIENALENHFKEKNLTVQVLNFAVGGYNLPQLEELLKFNAMPCKPVAVIYGFCQNDINDNFFVTRENSSFFGRWTYSKPSVTDVHKDMPDIMTLSFIKYTMNRQYLHMQPAIGNMSLDEFIRFEDNLLIDDKYETLRNMQRISTNNDAEFYMIVFPYLDSNEYRTLEFPLRFSEDNNVTLINLRESFISRNLSHLELMEDSEHFSDAGINMTIDIIIDEMDRLVTQRIIMKIEDERHP